MNIHKPMKDDGTANPFHSETQKTRLQCSVVVPVYNHWDLIPELIARLGLQSVGIENFELLLIDNGSNRIPEDLSLPVFARLFHCAKPGSYSARNEAIRHAHGKIMAFTDADCRPEPQWLEQGLACIRAGEHSDVIVAGNIRMTTAGDIMTPYEMYDVAMGLPQERFVRNGFGATANLFISNSIIDRIGQFEEGRLTGGDAEFCRRAGQYGIQVKYCELAVVQHPARRYWSELKIKSRRLLGGRIRFGPYHQRLYNVLHTLIPPVRRCSYILLTKQLNLLQRLTACVVQLRIWLVELQEVMRMLLGLSAERR